MNRIRQLREERGWKQSDLGDRLKLQKSAVSKYETERVPLTAETLGRLSEIFGVSVDYILGRTNIRNEAEKEALKQKAVKYQDLIENVDGLSEEGKQKAVEYIEMLKKMDDIENKGKIKDLHKRA